MIKQRPDKLGPQQRFFKLRVEGEAAIDAEARTARLSFSSEEPVEMWYGTEILSHAKGCVRLDGARQAGMPLLFNHDMNDLLGVVDGIEVSGGRGYATVRFGKDARGEWALQQVADGILRNSSFMYRVFTFEEDVEAETYTATDWEPYEISLVTVPADPTVGVGRAAGAEELSVEIVQRSVNPPASAEIQEQQTMLKHRHALQDRATDGTGGAGAGGATLSADEMTRLRAEVRETYLKDERARVTEIEAMSRAHQLPAEMRESLIANGTPIAEARGIVLNEISKRGTQKPLTSVSDDIGLTNKEKRSYSLMRAVNAAVNQSWENAGFEREVSQALAKRNHVEPKHGTSFFFPNDLPFVPTEEHRKAYWAMQRAMLERKGLSQRAIYQIGATATGGALVETDLLAESFIEVLRNQTVTQQLGALYLTGLVGAVDIPRQITATATYWVGESGALTESEGTFDKVSLRPKTVGALSKVSRLMLLQSTPAIEMIARRDLLAVGALAIDLAAISGSGASNQPTGIVNQSGVTSVVGGTNGANITFDNIIQLYSGPKIANAPMNSLGFAINAKTYGYLSTLKASTGSYLWMPNGGIGEGPSDTLRGYRYAVSNQLRSNLVKGSSGAVCSESIFGNWQELLIGEWGITEIAVNPYDSTGFANGDVILRMFQTLDIGVRHGGSFAVMSDALTPGF